MSSNHGRAPARESAALAWLARYDPFDGYGGQIGPERASDPSLMFTQPVVIEAFLAGMDERLQVESVKGDDAAKAARQMYAFSSGRGMLSRSEAGRIASVIEFLWNDMGEARRLIDDAASLFRMYGRHHRDQAEALRNKGPVEAVAFHDRIAKATRNEAMAARLERWLKGDPENPAEVLRKISEGIAERSGLEVDHAAFDEAAARLDEQVDWTPIATPGEDTVIAHAEPISVSRVRRPGTIADLERVEVEDGGIERVVTGKPRFRYTKTSPPFFDGTCRYTPDDCDFPVGGEINWGSGERSFDSVATREQARRIADRDLERCRAHFDNGPFNGFPPHPAERLVNRERNIDHDLLDKLNRASRSPWRKAWDWVIAFLDGRAVGYKQGGFVQTSIDAVRPDVREKVRQAMRDSVATLVSPPLRFDTAGDTATFRLSTPDPRFDPAEPVLVNGYPYRPATKD